MLRSIARFITGKLLPRRPYKVLTGPLKGAKFQLGSLSGEGGGASVYLGMMEPEQTTAMASEIGEGAIFFDIGANVGYYSMLVSKLAGPSGKVFAFEPLPANIEFLKQHISLNSADNVSLEPVALSDKAGVVRFSFGANRAEGHIGEDGDIEVRTITLDEFVADKQIGPTVVKMDVEGAEQQVFIGGAETFETYHPLIFLSTHSPELRSWCLAHLKELGYTTEPLMEGDGHEFIARYSG